MGSGELGVGSGEWVGVVISCEFHEKLWPSADAASLLYLAMGSGESPVSHNGSPNHVTPSQPAIGQTVAAP